MESGGSKVGKASVDKASSSLRSDDDNHRFLFMFVRREDGVYLLYKIDIDDCFKKNSLEEIPLSPLIVFGKKSLATDSYFAFAFLQPHFYFIGGDNNKIFTVKKSTLLKLDPSEKRRGSQLLRPLSSMNGTKLNPLAFTFRKKLYVISKGYYHLIQQIGNIYFDFEVYSPKTNSWTDLGNKPLRECYVQSHLVHHDMVYFTTAEHVVLSFNLIDENWVSIFDPYGVLARYPEFYVRPRPTFDTDIQIIGDLVFGGIYRQGSAYFDISASPCLIPSDDMFLRPSLTHDESFYHHIYSVPHLLRRPVSSCSKSLVTIDNNKGIICVICYGNQPSDQFANYAVLNFFSVNGDSYQDNIIHEPEEQEDGKEPVLPFHWNRRFNYAKDKDKQHVNFFSAEFLFATVMPIDTYKQVTPGVIYSSIIV